MILTLVSNTTLTIVQTNILVSHDGCARLTGFGLTRVAAGMTTPPIDATNLR